MSKLTLGIIGGLLSAIIGFIAWQQLTPPDPFLARQVKTIAPAEDNYLIDFYPHITDIQGPEARSPFPMPKTTKAHFLGRSKARLIDLFIPLLCQSSLKKWGID